MEAAQPPKEERKEAREEGGAAARKQAEPQAAVSLFLLGAFFLGGLFLFFLPRAIPSTVCRDSVATKIFNFHLSIFNLDSPLGDPSVILRRSFDEIPATP